MKNLVTIIFLSLTTVLSSQTPTNIQIQVVSGVVSGTSPANPNAYSFQENGNTLQGVIINLPATEITTLTLQSNNCRLKFKNPPAYMQSVELNFDNQGFQSFHSGGSIQETNWITPPSAFMTVGVHNLKVRFLAFENFTREYNVFVTDACSKFYVDGTISSLTTGNTLTLWDNPSCTDAEPLLLSEGFDPTNSTFPEFYRFRGDELTQKFFELGYKIYILNYNLAGQNMQNNAAVYTSALQFLSQINGGKKVLAAGMSMGGVIARYALAKGEADNLNLPVSMFISLDAPQRGAVIDRPFQDLIKSKQPNTPALNAPVSRQLLINHAWENGESHNAFYDELRALNGDGYPHKIPRIGVAFSNDVLNPNSGMRWLKFDILAPGQSHNNFFVTGDWAQAGSFLPGSTSNLDPLLPNYVQALFPGSTIEVERFSHPTFIPYRSALDIAPGGINNFPIRVEANAASAHDEVPTEIVNRLDNAMSIVLGAPSSIAANETFNFTSLQGNSIRRDITVFGNLVINRNGQSGSSLMPQPESPTSLFNLRTKSCDPVLVNIEGNGKLELGDMGSSGDLNTVLTLKSGDELRLKSNSTLRIKKNSQIVVGSGAKLIIDVNCTLDLVDSDSKIVIQSGGELIINGDFAFSGSGYFSFENGNKLTLNTDWTLTGSGKNTRLINVENDAEIKINNGRRWTIKDALVRKVGSVSGDVLLFENGSTLSAENVTFDDQVSGGSFSFVADYEAIDLDNNPNDMEYSFKNCAFANTAYAVILGGFDNGNRFDFRNLNVEFINSTFTNCQQAAYYAEHGYITTFDNCTIQGGGIEIERMYWLQMRNTTMRGGTIGANKIGVKLSFSIHNWIRENCLISGYATGVDALTGINGNIILSDKTTIQSCGTAIKQNGGSDYGLLYMDCTAILENQNGITGTDILFSAYSRGGTANIYRKPLNNSTSLFLNNTFQARQETDIWLFGSYWDNQTPTTATVNNFWRFVDGNGNWTGTLHLDDITYLNSPDIANCGGIQLRDADNDSLARANAIVLVNGEYRNVRIQQNAALSQLRQNNLEDAIHLFSPVAGIVNGVRDTANSVVRYFVDVARVMAQGPNSVTIRSKSKGWLPETLVEIPKTPTEFIVSPNPASNAVQMSMKIGKYHLRVSNAVGQTIFSQNTEGVLSVNVATWANGIYLFELTDKTTNKRQRSKIVVQH